MALELFLTEEHNDKRYEIKYSIILESIDTSKVSIEDILSSVYHRLHNDICNQILNDILKEKTGMKILNYLKKYKI